MADTTKSSTSISTPLYLPPWKARNHVFQASLPLGSTWDPGLVKHLHLHKYRRQKWATGPAVGWGKVASSDNGKCGGIRLFWGSCRKALGIQFLVLWEPMNKKHNSAQCCGGSRACSWLCWSWMWAFQTGWFFCCCCLFVCFCPSQRLSCLLISSNSFLTNQQRDSFFFFFFFSTKSPDPDGILDSYFPCTTKSNLLWRQIFSIC